MLICVVKIANTWQLSYRLLIVHYFRFIHASSNTNNTINFSKYRTFSLQYGMHFEMFTWVAFSTTDQACPYSLVVVNEAVHFMMMQQLITIKIQSHVLRSHASNPKQWLLKSTKFYKDQEFKGHAHTQLSKKYFILPFLLRWLAAFHPTSKNCTLYTAISRCR